MTVTSTVTPDGIEPRPLRKLRGDIRRGVSTLTTGEVRWLVDTYYSIQDYRLQATGQLRQAAAEPHEHLAWLAEQMEAHELEIKGVLDVWTDFEPSSMGRWLKGIYGIGPVIAAGLLAHVDITHCPTAGHLWAFAGLDPTRVWAPKTKRPWNARLKVLTWKAGQSFMKFHNREDCYYGRIYAERKVLEQERNDAGLFADQAAAILAARRIGHDTDAYKAYITGRLPPAHVDARARRYAVKLFLAHFWQRAREQAGLDVPLPYPIAHLGHVHVIEPPN